jgi:hypothetical protein
VASGIDVEIRDAARCGIGCDVRQPLPHARHAIKQNRKWIDNSDTRETYVGIETAKSGAFGIIGKINVHTQTDRQTIRPEGQTVADFPD